MTPFEEWEQRHFPSASATAKALGVHRTHVYWLRRLQERPAGALGRLMQAIDRLRALGEPWPPD